MEIGTSKCDTEAYEFYISNGIIIV